MKLASRSLISSSHEKKLRQMWKNKMRVLVEISCGGVDLVAVIGRAGDEPWEAAVAPSGMLGSNSPVGSFPTLETLETLHRSHRRCGHAQDPVMLSTVTR